MPEYLRDFVKDPQAKLDYVIDFLSNGYLAPGETLVSAVFTVPAGLTKDDPHPESNTTTTATVWLSGGTVGQEYAVVCHIVTSEDRTDERSINIRVEDR
jgi:hypothetical protein